MLSLPAGLLDTVEQAIRNDDPSVLSEVLLEANASDDPKGAAYQKLLQNLLQRAITCRSKLCIESLLPQILSLDEEDDLHHRNILHRLVIHIGRAKRNEIRGANQSSDMSSGNAQFIVPAELPVNGPPPCETTENEHSNLLSERDVSVQFLKWLLDTLQPSQRIALQAKDNFGRFPLHYAAQYGFVVICQIIIKHMQDWNMFDVSKGIDAPKWQDSDGYAPLHLSVINQHPLTTKALLDAEQWHGATEEQLESRRETTKSGHVLALATQKNNVSIVQLLVEAGVNVNYQDEQGECALHVAARFGHTECARVLIMGSTTEKTNLNLQEKAFSWTPLFVACVDGHLSIVELLIAAGADLERLDSSLWTAKEHAALRGHMHIAEKLAPLTKTLKSPNLEPSSFPALSSSPPNALSLEDRRSHTVAKDPALRPPEPV
jgi:glycerophosphodiester phosphodiesterase